jgi:hypothetical protein
VAPWGWTWVGCEPWGFAPFHYGRWQQRGGRWGWIPGPPVVRPIYSPALVVFVGVDRLNPGGGPVTAWFPLGPREAYVPWYHASQRYVNRVNVSNIYDRDTVQVRNIYNQRTEVSAYAAAGQHGYVNRPTATIAVSQASFAAGKRVGQSTVQVNAEVLAAAPVLPHPLVTPQRARFRSVRRGRRWHRHSLMSACVRWASPLRSRATSMTRRRSRGSRRTACGRSLNRRGWHLRRCRGRCTTGPFLLRRDRASTSSRGRSRALIRGVRWVRSR